MPRRSSRSTPAFPASTLDTVEEFRLLGVDPGNGSVRCELTCPESLFFSVLSEQAGIEVADNAALLQTLTTLAEAKREYDKVADALAQVRATGYGVVMPDASELHLEKPEIVRKKRQASHGSQPSARDLPPL